MSVAAAVARNQARTAQGAVQLGLLQDTITRLANAADRGHPVLFAEASVLFRNLLGARELRIIVYSGGAWREWDRLDGEDDADPLVASLPQEASTWSGIVHYDSFTFAAVQPGSVALLVIDKNSETVAAEMVDSICHIFKLALGACESQHGNPDKLEAIRVFQGIANRILKSRNLQDIFLQITHDAKRRLSADICGIMLREGDALVMQRCVGNRAAETAALRMRSGQGVGGRVLATREPCSIEDYLQSEIISRDFFDLARIERVRSALAVPLLSQHEVIGVLEVWRRKPSCFTPQHTAELATLANLTSLAIENVGLTEARESAVLRLEEAHTELKRRYDVIHQSAELQESLIATLLAGGSLTDIAEKAHRHLGTPILFLDRHLETRACHPPGACSAELLYAVKTAISRNSGSETRLSTQSAYSIQFSFQPVITASEHFGWTVVINPSLKNESAQLALSAICVTTALHQMKEHATTRALSDKLTSLLWDLLEAPDHLRRLALERAKELNVEFSREYCVLICLVENLDQPNASGMLTGGEMESRRRTIAEAPSRLPGAQRNIKLSALRGNELGVISAFRDGGQIKEVAQGLLDEISRRAPGASARIGISKPSRDLMAMPLAWKDARIALDVARQAPMNRIVAYADMGVAGLLMSMREGASCKGFIAERLGKLLAQKTAQREVLLRTLRVFFAVNCSQQAAASELSIHQKTIAYRLAKIERITELNLAFHEHRVLLYLALRMYDLCDMSAAMSYSNSHYG
ncbi:MAG: helix-turn-helix domain-containing protein [Gammaproteobacteria bacterium]